MRVVLAVIIGVGAALVLCLRGVPAPPPFDPGRRNPFPPDAASLAEGERVYRANCESCHGADGRGSGPAAVNLDPRPIDFGIHAGMAHSDALLFHWISYGVEGTAMPAFDHRLSEAERWHVLNFIRNFRPQAE